jgi:hypothetical protein
MGLPPREKRRFSAGESALAQGLRLHGRTWREIAQELEKEFGYRRGIVTLRTHMAYLQTIYEGEPSQRQLHHAQEKNLIETDEGIPAATDGLSAQELDPGGKAAQEMRDLLAYIMSRTPSHAKGETANAAA